MVKLLFTFVLENVFYFFTYVYVLASYQSLMDSFSVYCCGLLNKIYIKIEIPFL